MRIGCSKGSNLAARTLSVQRYLLCASPGYLRKHGRPQAPSDLQRHNGLAYKGHRGG